jgi:hypothetical protein
MSNNIIYDHAYDLLRKDNIDLKLYDVYIVNDDQMTSITFKNLENSVYNNVYIGNIDERDHLLNEYTFCEAILCRAIELNYKIIELDAWLPNYNKFDFSNVMLLTVKNLYTKIENITIKNLEIYDGSIKLLHNVTVENLTILYHNYDTTVNIMIADNDITNLTVYNKLDNHILTKVTSYLKEDVSDYLYTYTIDKALVKSATKK